MAAPRPAASLETLLTRFRLITPEQLDEALREKAATGKDVGAVVVERGWVNEDQLSRLLSYAPTFSAEPTDPQHEPAPASEIAPALTHSEPPALELEPAPVAEFPLEPVVAEPALESGPFAEAAELAATWPTAELADPPAFPPALELIEPEPAPVALEPITPESEPVTFEPEPAAVEPEPVAVQPEAAPQPEPEPVAVVEPVEPIAVVEPIAPAPEPATEPAEPAANEAEAQVVRFVEPAAIETVARVFVRLSNGERVEAGSFDDMAAAKTRAEEVVAQVSNPDDRWPFLAGRYIRPEAVLSVDIEATVVRYA